MSRKKKWVVGLVVLALVIAAVFPVRAAVREYRYQKSLARMAKQLAWNPGHVSAAADIMCDLMAQALEAEDLPEMRENLLAVYVWAQDLEESMRSVRLLVNLYDSEHDALSAVAVEDPDIQAEGRLGYGLSDLLRPCLTGEADLYDETFRRTLWSVREDLRWMQKSWDEAFPYVDEMSDREFVAAYHTLYEQEEWDSFLGVLSQQD